MPQPDSESERDGDQERKPRHPQTVSEQGWTVLVTGAVLLVGLLSVWWSGPSVENIERTRAQVIPQVSPDKVPLVTGEEPLEQIFIRTGCPVCHTSPGIVGARGRVGPKLV